MATFILNYLVDPKFCSSRDISYQRAYLKRKEDLNQYHLHHSQGLDVKKVYVYFRDPITSSWRYGEEPHRVRGFFALLVLGTVIRFLAAHVFLAMQLGITIARVSFTCYKRSYPLRYKENFSDLVFQTMCLAFETHKEQFHFFKKKFILSFKIFIIMFVAAVAGMLSRDVNQVLKMEIIFSEMEKEWNQMMYWNQNNQEEKEWHVENTLLTRLLLHLKQGALNNHSFSSSNSSNSIWAAFLHDAKRFNHAFYLFPYAQPLSQTFINRLEWIPGDFSSYEEISRTYHTQWEQLQKDLTAC